MEAQRPSGGLLLSITHGNGIAVSDRYPRLLVAVKSAAELNAPEVRCRGCLHLVVGRHEPEKDCKSLGGGVPVEDCGVDAPLNRHDRGHLSTRFLDHLD